MSTLIDLTGSRWGQLTAIVYAGNEKWVWRCDCGAEKVIPSLPIRQGRQISCGCYRKKQKPALTHGLSKTNEHAIWRGMLSRCNNPNVKRFNQYGGRGIEVCDRWKKISNFYEDMGKRPSSQHSLDRVDSDGNYEPGNVRWATNAVQVNNRRNTRYVVFRGERLPLADAVRAAGSIVNIEAAHIRIKTGWDVELALTKPTQKRRAA